MAGDLMFGGPNGVAAFDANFRQNLKQALDAEQTLTATIPMYQAHSRLYNATAGKYETEAHEDAIMAQLMREASAPGGGAGVADPDADPDEQPSLSTVFGDLSRRAAARGLVNKSQELAKNASLILQREASARASGVKARLDNLKTIAADAELRGQLFGNVQNADDWARANALYEFQTGETSPFRGQEYSPGLVTGIRQSALTVKEQAEIEDRRLRLAQDKWYRGARLDQHNRNIDLAKERLKLAREAEERLKKAGGGKGTAGTPSDEERNEVKRLLRLDGINTESLSADSVNSTAFSIASRARELQQANRALGRSQAIQQAINEARENGDLEVERTGGVDLPFLGHRGGEQRFARYEIPKAARDRLKDGEETTFGNGQVWTLKDGKPKRVR